MDGHAVSPLDLFRTLPVGGGLLVPFRISCHKTTHANGYYGAWPGWAVSISVLPLTDIGKILAYNGASRVPQMVKNLQWWKPY